MKSFEQLARSGYEAYRKQINHNGEYAVVWDALLEREKEAWAAVAKQIVAEMATVH